MSCSMDDSGNDIASTSEGIVADPANDIYFVDDSCKKEVGSIEKIIVPDPSKVYSSVEEYNKINPLSSYQNISNDDSCMERLNQGNVLNEPNTTKVKDEDVVIKEEDFLFDHETSFYNCKEELIPMNVYQENKLEENNEKPVVEDQSVNDNSLFESIDVTMKECKNSNNKSFRCIVCGKQFSTEKYLVTHQILQCKLQSTLFECDKADLMKHDTHLGIDTSDILSNKNIIHETLPVTLDNSGNEITGDSRNTKTAENCDVSTKIHHKESLSGVKLNSGNICLNQFSSEASKTYHLMKMKIIYTKPFSCDKCGKEFFLKHHLQSHQYTHSSEKPFTCDFCDRGFTSNSRRLEHQRVHSEGKFKCHICSKEFSRKSCLKTHVIEHTSEKNLKCDVCGGLFNTKRKLNRHMKEHNKPYKCEYCNNSFAYECHLTFHRRRHNH